MHCLSHFYLLPGSAGGYYYSLQLPMHGAQSSLGQVWVQATLLAVSTVFFAWVDLRHQARVRAKRQALAAGDSPANPSVNGNPVPMGGSSGTSQA